MFDGASRTDALDDASPRPTGRMVPREQPLGTAVVGYGYWGPNLARNVAECPGPALEALCELDPAQLSLFRRRHPGAAARYASWTRCSSTPRCEAVVIATPPQTHHALAARALRAGKHVLVEKPLATTSEDARDLAALAAAHERVLMPGHTFIYSPAVNTVRELIRDGVVGDVHFVTSSRMNLGKYNGDGVVCDLAPHDLSILLYWLDQPVVGVAASGSSVLRQGVPETAFLTLTFAEGPTANVQISWLAPRKVRQMIVVGSQRMVQYDDTASDEPVRVYDRGLDVAPPTPANFGEHQLIYRTGDVVIPRVEPREPLRLELEDFAHAIRTGEEPRSSLALGLDIVATIELAAGVDARRRPAARAARARRPGSRLRSVGARARPPLASPNRPAGAALGERPAPVARTARPRVLSVIGARPEIIQAAPVCEALAPLAEEILVHTGQHYDDAMSERQILATRLPRPHHNLGVGSRAREAQLDLARERLEDLICAERPDAVIVRGDTNATLSGALAAVACGVPLVHVEAGLRSHRADMPEEHNRIETDRLAQVLCAPTPGAQRNLEAEGVAGAIHVTGDPLCDTLESWRARVRPAGAGDYVLATVHRNYNTDSPERLAAVLACLARSPLPVLLPLHPRTRAALDAWGLAEPDNVRLLEPVPYTRMLELERGARAIATDSGGVQREAYLWGVRCVTLREETEWVDTVETGWNTLVGSTRTRSRPRCASRCRPSVRRSSATATPRSGSRGWSWSTWAGTTRRRVRELPPAARGDARACRHGCGTRARG